MNIKKTVFIFYGLLTSFILHGMKNPESHDEKGVKFDYQKHGKIFKKTVEKKSEYLQDKARYISYEGKKIPLSVGAFNDSKELKEIFDLEHADKDEVDYGYVVSVDTLLKGQGISLEDLVQFSFFSFHINKISKALQQDYLLHLATVKKLTDQEKPDALRVKNLSFLLDKAGVDTALNLVRIADVVNNQKLLNFLFVALSQKIQEKDFLSQDTKSVLAKVLERFGDEDLSAGFSKIIINRYPKIKSTLLAPDKLQGNSEINGSIPLSDNKSIVSWHTDGSVIVWDVTQGKRLYLLKGHTKQVNDVKELPSKKHIVSSADDGKAIIWDLVKGVKIKELGVHKKPIKHLVVSENQIITADSELVNGVIKVWDIKTDNLIYSLQAPSKTTKLVGLSGGRFVSGHDNGAIIVWELGKKKVEQKNHGNEILQFLQIPNSELYLSLASSEKIVNIWNMKKNKEAFVNQIQDQYDFLRLLPISQDRIISAHTNYGVKIRDIKKNKKYEYKSNIRGVIGELILSKGKKYFFTNYTFANITQIRSLKDSGILKKQIDFSFSGKKNQFLNKIILFAKNKFISISSGAVGIWDIKKLNALPEKNIDWKNAGDSVVRLPVQDVTKAFLMADRYLIGWQHNKRSLKIWDLDVLRKIDTLQLSQLDLIMRLYLNKGKPYQMVADDDDYELYKSLDKRLRKALVFNDIVLEKIKKNKKQDQKQWWEFWK